jgi:hypothetical protein
MDKNQSLTGQTNNPQKKDPKLNEKLELSLRIRRMI